MEFFCSGKLGKCELNYSFHYPETVLYFHSFLKRTDTAKQSISVHKTDFEWAEKTWNMKSDGNLEFALSLYRTSDFLTHYNSCLIHGAAILWNHKAFLLCADSGIGKTTQIKNWMTLYGNEIKIMNGDKPVLCLESDGSVSVFPSPWKGKEGWGDDTLIAPLGGIVILKQGHENIIKRIQAVNYASRLYSFFFSRFEDENAVRKLCEIETAIWKTIPVWQLTNTGDLESAKITRLAFVEASNEIQT